MGERFAEMLVNGMKRMHATVSHLWKRYTRPAGAGRNETRMDPR